MKILIIDNYDSFTYNLYQVCGELLLEKGIDFDIDVIRNDKITLSEIKRRGYDRIIISPGPGDPSDKAYFGVCADVLLEIGKTIPVLGVCLGMQGMAYYFGGKIVRAQTIKHGKTSPILHDGKGVFQNVPQEVDGMRYHSLIADPESLPKCLEITAVSSRAQSRDLTHQSFKTLRSEISPLTSFGRNDKSVEIMGLRHKIYPIEGIQFHPESFATEAGKLMLSNFLFQKGGAQ